MNAADAVNFQSLNMVRDELVATIEDSARSLENFVSYQDDGESLQQCINGIKQIGGILRLIQFKGATMLAEELLAVANEIVPGNSGAFYERRLEVVSNTFFVLTRYLEYVQQKERKVHVLLIPQINELRKIRNEPSYPECHFFSLSIANFPIPPKSQSLSLSGKSFVDTVKRLRHMYQVGLLGLFREKQVKNSLLMMRRTAIRMQRLGGHSKPLSLLWWLANVTLEVMADQDMEVIETRKILFGRIDRVTKQVEKAGESAFDAAPPKSLMKELVYLVALSGSQSPDAKKVLEAFGQKPLPYSDKELAKERQALNGPSAQTVSSLAKVLKDELTHTKNVLETAAQSEARQIDDLDGFVQNLRKVADILNVVGLVSPSNILRDEITRVAKWGDSDDGADADEMLDVANTLLYLESTVSALENAKLSGDKLEKATKIAQREVIASGALAEAARIVIDESEAGLSLTKRAINSFSDSSYDVGHIRNIAKTLNTVRGGMIMLKKERAAMILHKCVEFVEKVLLDQEQPPTLKELLETFADAIIAIEYYLNSTTANLQMDDNVLQLAEESLEALGFPVESTD